MKKKDADSEFEQQRKAIIEAALQEGRTKGFASISSKQVITTHATLINQLL